MALSPADALYGAAYQVLYEKIMPDRCVNHEILTHIPALKEWIATQSGEVSIAYMRALVDITKRATDVLENNDREAQMREARKTLPIPP